MKICSINSINTSPYISKNKELKPSVAFANNQIRELIGVPKSYISFGNSEIMNKKMIGEFLKYIDVSEDFYDEENPIYMRRANERIERLRNERNGFNIRYWFGKVSKTEAAKIREEEYDRYLQEKELYDKFRTNEAYYRSLIGSEEIEVYNRTKKILQDKFTLSQVIAGYDSLKSELYKLIIEPIQKENMLGTNEKIPPSILLYGPTGCGKSKTAKFIGDEIGCNVISFPQDVKPRKFIGQLKMYLDEARDYYFEKKEFIDKTYESKEYLNADIEQKAKIKAGLKSPRTIIVIDEIDKYFKENDQDNPSELIDMNKIFLKGILDHCSERPQKDMLSDAAGVTILFTTNHPSLVDTEISLRSGKCERMAVNFPKDDDIKNIIKYYIDNYTNVKVEEANNNGANIPVINSNELPYGRHVKAAQYDEGKGAHTCASIESSVVDATKAYLKEKSRYNTLLKDNLTRTEIRVKPEKIKEFQNEILQMGLAFREIDEKEEFELLSELKNLDMITDVQKLRLEYLTTTFEKETKEEK